MRPFRQHHSKSSLNDAVQAVHEHAAGALKVTTMMPEEFPLLLAAATGGDPECKRLLPLLLDALKSVQNAPAKAPLLCAACPAPLEGPFSVVITEPAIEGGEHALALGVCRRCGPDTAKVEAAAHKALRKFWPDLRMGVVHPAVGHA